MPHTVTVRVPATSANLGPGFDSIGLALAITQDVTVSLRPLEPHPGGLSKLALDAARAAYRLAHVETPAELYATARPMIPVGRGLGASAAARAAGIAGANALMGGVLTPDRQLMLGANLEGHADNVAPALFGGLRVVVHEGDRYLHVAARLAPGLKIVLYVPDFDMPTNESRKLLPHQLSREDAIHNIGRAALLVAALANGDWDVLDAATQDRLHQPARTQLFPSMPEIFAAAKAAGALCAYLSGGGSTIAAFALSDEQLVADAMTTAASAHGLSGRARITEPSAAGAAVSETA